MIKLNGLVLVYDNYILKHFKKTGIVTELYHGNSDNEIRGASLRINRSGQRIKRPIKKLYPLKVTEENENMERGCHFGRSKKTLWTLLRCAGGVFVITRGFVISKSLLASIENLFCSYLRDILID